MQGRLAASLGATINRLTTTPTASIDAAAPTAAALHRTVTTPPTLRRHLTHSAPPTSLTPRTPSLHATASHPTDAAIQRSTTSPIAGAAGAAGAAVGRMPTPAGDQGPLPLSATTGRAGQEPPSPAPRKRAIPIVGRIAGGLGVAINRLTSAATTRRSTTLPMAGAAAASVGGMPAPAGNDQTHLTPSPDHPGSSPAPPSPRTRSLSMPGRLAASLGATINRLTTTPTASIDAAAPTAAALHRTVTTPPTLRRHLTHSAPPTSLTPRTPSLLATASHPTDAAIQRSTTSPFAGTSKSRSPHLGAAAAPAAAAIHRTVTTPPALRRHLTHSAPPTSLTRRTPSLHATPNQPTDAAIQRTVATPQARIPEHDPGPSGRTPAPPRGRTNELPVAAGVRRPPPAPEPEPPARITKAQRTHAPTSSAPGPAPAQTIRRASAAPTTSRTRRTSSQRIQRQEGDETSILGSGENRLSRIEIDAIVAALEDRILEDLARRGGRYLGQF